MLGVVLLLAAFLPAIATVVICVEKNRPWLAFLLIWFGWLGVVLAIVAADESVTVRIVVTRRGSRPRLPPLLRIGTGKPALRQAPTSRLDEQLQRIDEAWAAGTITDDEWAAARQRAVAAEFERGD